MAFKKSLKYTRLGVPVSDAYLKIVELRGNKDGIAYTVNGYISRESANARGQEIFSLHLHFVPAGQKRWDAQAYEHAKTLPELEGVEDILEQENEAESEAKDGE